MADPAATRPAGGMLARTALVPLVLVAALACLPWIAAVTGSGALTSFATRILILAIAASSLNLILGCGGLVSFGHAAWYGIGGYVVGILYQHSRQRRIAVWPVCRQQPVAGHRAGWQFWRPVSRR